MSFPDAMSDYAPLYERADGKSSRNIAELLDPASLHYSLSRLALYFSYPALISECMPESPWQSIRRVRPLEKWPTRSASAVTELQPRFAASVKDCIGDANTVAVSFSGGLDSLAVLSHAAALGARIGRRIVAIVANLLDDEGEQSAQIAQTFIRDLAIPCALEVIEPAELPDTPIRATAWDMAGPSFTAMPELAAAINRKAEAWHADVLLTGNGSDELLGAVRYLSASYTNPSEWTTLWRYLRDIAAGGRTRLLMETLAMCSRVIPARTRAHLYWAANNQELSFAAAPHFVGKAYRGVVADWTAAWVRSLVEMHATSHRQWAIADAWDSVFPLDLLPASGSVVERSPFLAPAFANYAMQIPLKRRYDGRLPYPYHRSKALVVQVFPSANRQHLPQRKQLYSQEFARQQAATAGTVRRCIELGLIDAAAFARLTDPATLHTIQAVEHWIVGAERRGARCVD